MNIGMDLEKYEYLLNTWGGFYKDEHKAKHGLEPGYSWFFTAEERERHIEKLKYIEKQLGAQVLCVKRAEGKNTRYRSVAKMVFVYQRKEYPYVMDFGFGCSEDLPAFMFYEGNYACDCNRSLFLNEVYENAINNGEELECGDTITIKDFTVELVRMSCDKQNVPEDFENVVVKKIEESEEKK